MVIAAGTHCSLYTPRGNSVPRFLLMIALLAVPFSLTGCDQEVMEAETPQGEVEVEREFGTGDLEVETED